MFLGAERKPENQEETRIDENRQWAKLGFKPLTLGYFAEWLNRIKQQTSSLAFHFFIALGELKKKKRWLWFVFILWDISATPVSSIRGAFKMLHGHVRAVGAGSSFRKSVCRMMLTYTCTCTGLLRTLNRNRGQTWNSLSDFVRMETFEMLQQAYGNDATQHSATSIMVILKTSVSNFLKAFESCPDLMLFFQWSPAPLEVWTALKTPHVGLCFIAAGP